MHDGQTFRLDRDVRVNVPQGDRLRLFAMSRECDLLQIKPCPEHHEQAIDNDNPGYILDLYPSAQAALGAHHSAEIANDNYELSYTVSEAP